MRIGAGAGGQRQEGLDASCGNGMGWTPMLCALKMYLERVVDIGPYTITYVHAWQAPRRPAFPYLSP